MIRPIPRSHLPVILDRILTFDDPRMARDIMAELAFGYRLKQDATPILEALRADNGNKFQAAAAKLLDREAIMRRQAKVSARLLTIDLV
jgi:hypothetical protein